MDWQYTPYISHLVLSAGIAIALGWYARTRRNFACALPLMALMFAVAEWCLAYALRLGYVGLDGKLFWTRIQYFGIVTVPGAWLALALAYPGREQWLTRRTLALLSIEPVLMLLLVWTHGWLHNWIWHDIKLASVASLTVWESTPGPGYILHSFYAYALLVAGTVLLVQSAIRVSSLYRDQASALLFSAIFPIIVNAFSFFDWNPWPYLDFTPLALTVSGLTLAWALFGSGLLHIIPVAREAIIEGMTDGVIVLDTHNRIVDMNLVARRIIGSEAPKALGQPVSEVLGELPGLAGKHLDETPVRSEIVLKSEEDSRKPRYYDFRVSLLTNRRNKLVGYVMVFHDITALKRTEDTLRSQKQLLEVLVSVARATVERPALAGTLQSTLDIAANITQAEGGSLFLLDENGKVTHCLLALGKPVSQKIADVTQQVFEKGLAGWVAQSLQPTIVEDTRLDSRWLPSPETLPDTRAALSLPIARQNTLMGVLTLTHPTPAHFTEEHLQMMKAAADQIALALRNAQIFEAQRELANRLITVYEVLRGVSGTLNPKTVPHVAVDRIARLTDWPAVAILVPDKQMDTAALTPLRQVNATTSTPHSSRELIVQAATSLTSVSQGWRLPIRNSVAGQAFTTGKIQLKNQQTENASTGKQEDGPSVEELAAPLRRGTRVLGVLNIQADPGTSFTEEDVRLAELLADAIAMALDSAHSHAEVGQYVTDLGAMYEVARTITHSLILEEILSETLTSALSTLGFDAGFITLADPHNGQLGLSVEKGIPEEISKHLYDERFEGSLSAYVHKLAQPVVLADIERDTSHLDHADIQKSEIFTSAIDRIHTMKMRACACIPLLHQKRSIGVLSLFAKHTIETSPHRLALQVAIGQQIATAIVNAQLFQAIEEERSRLQALIESSRDGILFVDLQGRILVINAQALRFLHLGNQPEAWINKSVIDLISQIRQHAEKSAQKRIVRAMLHEVKRTRRGKTEAHDGEFEFPPHILQWLHLPVEAGIAASGRLIVLRDVTEARSLERMREDLTHAMVHDLRNPLTGIFGALKLLNGSIPHGLLRPSQYQMLALMQSSAQQMISLVNDILDISRLESGRMPIECSHLKPRNVIERIINTEMPLANEKGIHLIYEVPPDILPAWADIGLIERVLQNLVGNAIKFTPPDGHIKVKASEIKTAPEANVASENIASSNSKPRRIRICVSDTGEGIPTEMRERLFQKFATGQQVGSGSGLGLAFCKMVLESHNERIWLEQTSEQGTTFCFTLPTRAED
jgi:PAS domain S-box-containing protein